MGKIEQPRSRTPQDPCRRKTGEPLFSEICMDNIVACDRTEVSFFDQAIGMNCKVV